MTLTRIRFGRIMLPIIMIGILLSSSDCDVGCELPEPSDSPGGGWRHGIVEQPR